MPLTKNGLIRYFLINECLTSKTQRYWTLENILKVAAERDVQVVKRTLEKDLHAMRYDERLNYKAPISYCKINKGFYYTDAEYSIERLPLTKDDIETFDIMVQALQRFRGAQLLNQVEGMFDKLGKVAAHLKQKKSKSSYPAVVFEHQPDVKGMQHFDVLHEAISKEKPMLIGYKKFEHEVAEYVFHPYLLKEYKFRWYVLGYSEKRKSKVILALDRIEYVLPQRKTVFIPYKGKAMQNYFEHTIGVTISARSVEEITLWFSPAQAHYIRTQWLHDTQVTISDDAKAGMVVTVQLIPNYELLQLLLSYGPEVKVLQPTSVRNEVKAMLEKSWRLYG